MINEEGQMNDMLKSCPFCGGKVYISLCGGADYQGYWLQVNGGIHDGDCHCRAYMESEYFEDEGGEDELRERATLIAKWNRRAR